MNRISEYIQYHVDSSRALDIDPQVEAIQYICERFELNREQRYWLCFLFSTNYCVPTTYFMYNEFPDYSTVDTGRLQRWWEANRGKLIFQTDKRWIRSRNQFVGVYESYKRFVDMFGDGQQEVAIKTALGKSINPYRRYYSLLQNYKVDQFGRFAMFLYSELLHVICGENIGVSFDIREAESSRNGLVYALGAEDYAFTGHGEKTLSQPVIDRLNQGLMHIAGIIQQADINPRHKTLWSIETTLCAYKKHKLNGARYIGYYIERMRKEIEKMEALTGKASGGGISWRPLWEFRQETYATKYLQEWQQK